MPPPTTSLSSPQGVVLVWDMLFEFMSLTRSQLLAGLYGPGRAHFNGAHIVVHSVNRAQSREADFDYRSDVIGTGRVPDDRSQTPPSPQ